MKGNLVKELEDRVFVFDGAMGTMLQSMGLKSGECPEVWNMTREQEVAFVHEAYLKAGSDLILTNTFGGSSIKLREYNLEKQAYDINFKAAELAKKAAASYSGLAVGTIGPLGQHIRPFGEISFDKALKSFCEQTKALTAGGVDVINIETMSDISEMRAALIAAKEAADLPVIAQMTFGDGLRTVFGTDPTTAVTVMESLGADMVGANCSGGPQELLPVIEEMAKVATVPIVVKPNAGLPVLRQGQTVFPASPQTMADYAELFVEQGVNIIGGCCGTKPEHIEAVRERVSGKQPKKQKNMHKSRLCSRNKTITLPDDTGILIIGEKINPTASKKLQKELTEGKLDHVRQLAKQQGKEGAHVLDLNVGIAAVNEKEVMGRVVEAVSAAVDNPVAIDSMDVNVLEENVRKYPGKTLINSVTGEEDKLKQILPMAKKFGAAIIGLAVDENGIPETAEQRLAIAELIIKKALKAGIRREDIFIDCLVMTAAANPEAARETMKSIHMIKEKTGVKTVLGLSNISHGLPSRDILNSTFFGACLGSGLDAVILDPGQESVKKVLRCWDVLTGRDKGARQYIELYSEKKDPREGKKELASGDAAIEDQLKTAIVDGDKESALAWLRDGQRSHFEPMDLVDQVLIPALEEVGEKYEKGLCYLPQLILSAEAAELISNEIEKGCKDMETRRHGTIVMATVKGDIHDIGKNIVSVLLRNHGFKVVDLGKDVDRQTIAQSAQREKADIIGLSALMTTTMQEMEETIDYLKRKKVNGQIMVGGAVITPDYAAQIKADGYGTDAQDAVRKVKLLMNKRARK